MVKYFFYEARKNTALNILSFIGDKIDFFNEFSAKILKKLKSSFFKCFYQGERCIFETFFSASKQRCLFKTFKGVKYTIFNQKKKFRYKIILFKWVI